MVTFTVQLTFFQNFLSISYSEIVVIIRNSKNPYNGIFSNRNVVICLINRLQFLYLLFSQGVPREYLALISIPVTLVSIIAPLIIQRTKLPLHWFAGSYVLCLIVEIPIAVYVYFTSRMIPFSFYYPVLVLLLTCNDFTMTIRFAAYIGFFTSISEPRIGGTYMTLLVTVANLGFAVNSSIVLYLSDWLPKQHAYVIAVGASIVLGSIWLACFSGILKRLQKVPTHKWHLTPQIATEEAITPIEQSESDHTASLIPEQETDPCT